MSRLEERRKAASAMIRVLAEASVDPSREVIEVAESWLDHWWIRNACGEFGGRQPRPCFDEMYPDAC
jgi:hypothetical protein